MTLCENLSTVIRTRLDRAVVAPELIDPHGYLSARPACRLQPWHWLCRRRRWNTPTVAQGSGCLPRGRGISERGDVEGSVSTR